MPQEIFLGAAIGALIGFVIAIPAIMLESMRRVRDLPILIDVKFLFGRKLTDGEVFVVSLLLHLVISTLAGGIYALFAESGWLFITNDPYALPSLLIFFAFAWIVVGSLIFPLLGLGFFGRREGKHVWLEMLIMHELLAFGYWLAVSYYQPIFF